MKKLMIAALAAGVLLVGGCGCKKEGCKPGSLDPKCDRCTTEYCKYIGSRMSDPRVAAGETVTFEDGTVIRSMDKKKITKWETFQEMNAPKKAAVATPAAAKPAVTTPAAAKPAVAKPAAAPATAK